MVDSDESILFRYPGTNFFEEKQESIFFGREMESVELIHAVKAHDVFVIFANSGIGKTSLLNARLIPRLRTEQFLPLRFRFQDTSLTPIQEIKNKLIEFLPTHQQFENKRLWDIYKTTDFGKKKALFIFDQFEEFFNHPKNDRDNCLGQLSELISGHLPDYISREMRQKFRKTDPTEKDLLYYTPADVKFLFLIRADKLNLLDDLSTKIPLILRNRFQLKPLTVAQAGEAIQQPAKLQGKEFATPPINMDAVLAQICNYLKNEEDEVESFQLQILCRELEKRKISEYKANPKTEQLPITEVELGGDAGMSNIIQNYYINQIKSIDDEELRKKATILIEDELIIDGRRISMPEKFLMNKGYSVELLNYLVDNTRLIRGDIIRKERYFEISHDKLLDPILKSREFRLNETDKQKKITELQKQKELEEVRNKELQRQQLEEKERNRLLQLQTEAEIRKNNELNTLKITIEKKAQRLKAFSIGMVILFIATLLLLVYANNLRIESKLNNVQKWIEKEDYETAHKVLNYNSAIKISYFGFLDTLKKLETSIETMKLQKEKFMFHSDKGDSFRLKKGDNLIKALGEYEQAGKVGYEPKKMELKKKMDDLRTEINDEFKRYIEKMNVFEKAEGVDDALSAYNVASNLFPKTELDQNDADYYRKLLDNFKNDQKQK